MAKEPVKAETAEAKLQSPAVKEAVKDVVEAVADAADAIASDSKAKEAAKAPKANGKPKAYISTSDTYVGGRYFKAGEPFVTDEPKGNDWEAVDDAAKAAAEAAQPLGAGDPPLESMDLSALKAFAATKNVRADGLNKDELLAAIRAANEPKL